MYEQLNENNNKDACMITFLTYVIDRENYFEVNTPTVNGNFEYERLCGFVNGYLTAKNWSEEIIDKDIYIKSRSRTIAKISKWQITEQYKNCINDNRKTLNALLR